MLPFKKISTNKDGYMLMTVEDKGKSGASQENHVRTILETMRDQMGYEQEDEPENDWDDDDFEAQIPILVLASITSEWE